MRVLALSLVTNNAVLEAGPKGDDTQVKGSSREELSRTIAQGKANHEEVINAGQEAAADVQVCTKCTLLGCTCWNPSLQQLVQLIVQNLMSSTAEKFAVRWRDAPQSWAMKTRRLSGLS